MTTAAVQSDSVGDREGGERNLLVEEKGRFHVCSLRFVLAGLLVVGRTGLLTEALDGTRVPPKTVQKIGPRRILQRAHLTVVRLPKRSISTNDPRATRKSVERTGSL